MAEENNQKSKRDLMWEQKKKMREERLKSRDSLQNFKNENNNGIYNTIINSNENIKSSENLPEYFPAKQENTNIANNFQTPPNYNIYQSENLAKQPSSQPSFNNMHMHNEPNQNLIIQPNNYQNNFDNYNINNNFPSTNRSKTNNANLNQQPEINEYSKQDISFTKNQNQQSRSPIPNEDPKILNKIIKKEYGDFLKNQMKEKENQRVISNDKNKVQQLQSMMENQAYNPFGKPGGGGPNKKINFSNPNKIVENNYNIHQQQNNYSNNNPHGPQKNPIYPSEMQQENMAMGNFNEYNFQLQNNLQNLQKDRMKMENYKNYINQNSNPNNFNKGNIYDPYANNFQPNQNVMQNFPSNNQNFQNLPANIGYYQENNNAFLPPNQQFYPNNQNQFQQNDNNPYNNDNFPNENNYPAAKIQSFEPQINYDQRNINSKSQDNSKNIGYNNNMNSNGPNMNAGSIPSMKVRTGRNRLMYENIGENELIKKEVKAQEMQKALLEQIEIKKRQKEMEKERKRMEEVAEEARLQKEREQIEWEKKQEEEKKKAKFERVQQENLDLKEDRFSKKQKNDDFSKEISAENLVKKPLVLRTDVSKEFLEQEGKRSRKNGRTTRQAFRPDNFITVNNNENFGPGIQNSPQEINFLNEEKASSRDLFSNNKGNEGFEMHRRERELEIQNLKNEAKNQQKNMQEKLIEIQNEAANAIKMKNQAEQELLNLRQVLKEKMLEEEKYKQNLLLALKKHDPGQIKRGSSNHRPADLPNQQNFLNNFPDLQNFAPLENNTKDNTNNFNKDLSNKFNFNKPLKIFEKGGITTNKEGFQEAYHGDKTLISDTKLIPLDILDHYAKQNGDSPLTLSKVGHLAIRPNSSNLYENSNKFDGDMRNLDSRNQNTRNFIIKKRPFSQKNQRYQNSSSNFDTKPNYESSINSEITKEIDQILKNHQEEINTNKFNTFNQAAHGILQSNAKQMSPISQNNAVGIKLDSEFPTLKDQSLYSVRSFGMKQAPYENSRNFEEIDKLMQNKEKTKINSKRNEDNNYKDQTIYSTINLEDLNKKNDERLKEIDMIEKMIGGAANKNANRNLNIIEEEDEMAKLDKIIKNF